MLVWRSVGCFLRMRSRRATYATEAVSTSSILHVSPLVSPVENPVEGSSAIHPKLTAAEVIARVAVLRARQRRRISRPAKSPLKCAPTIAIPPQRDRKGARGVNGELPCFCSTNSNVLVTRTPQFTEMAIYLRYSPRNVLVIV